MVNKNKQQTESVVGEVLQPVTEPNTVEIHKFDWKKVAILCGSMLIMTLIFLYFIMFTNYEDKLTKYMGAAGMGSIALLIIMFRVVQISVGWSFVRKILWVSKNKVKGYIMLKVHTVSGRPKYEVAKGGRWITYQFEENGNKISKRMFYDPLAIYHDYGADIPILEGTPDDIFPTNRFTGTRVTTSPELVEKTIIDSSRSADELDKYKQYTKYAMYGLGIMAVGLFFGFDLYRQAIADSNAAVIEATKLCTQSATIVAGTTLTNFKRRLKL